MIFFLSIDVNPFSRSLLVDVFALPAIYTTSEQPFSIKYSATFSLASRLLQQTE